MGISVTTEAYCDHCGCTSCPRVVAATHSWPLLARAKAREAGWVYRLNKATGEREDICPFCQEQEDGGGDG